MTKIDFLKIVKKNFWYIRNVELVKLIIFYIGNIYLKLKLQLLISL
jgi:hypothetical protein